MRAYIISVTKGYAHGTTSLLLSLRCREIKDVKSCLATAMSSQAKWFDQAIQCSTKQKLSVPLV